MDIHAVSITPGELATECGVSVRGVICTGWSRPIREVVAGVTCIDCLVAIGVVTTTRKVSTVIQWGVRYADGDGPHLYGNGSVGRELAEYEIERVASNAKIPGQTNLAKMHPAELVTRTLTVMTELAEWEAAE